MRGPSCMKCGKPVADEKTEFCYDCSRRRHRFTRGGACLVYDRLMKASIGRFKYHNRREYADFYAQELYAGNRRMLASWEPDVLIPVPIHRNKYRKRGFNQAALVAERLGGLSGIPVDKTWLMRVVDTRPQKELNDAGRRENLKNAFQVAENDVDYKRVVLVDDIYTTGSTVDAACAVLLEAGVENVYFLSVCIGRDY